MGKFYYRVGQNMHLERERGEITYRISPLKEKTPFPIPFQREEPSLYKEYIKSREETRGFCDLLVAEDFMLASPVRHRTIKWYLGHTSWFFETYLLNRFMKNYKEFSPQFDRIFAERYQEDRVIEFSRPTVDEILSYRNYVDQGMMEFFQSVQGEDREEIEYLVRMGLNLEGEVQEEIFSILKYAMYVNHEFTPMFKETLKEKSGRFSTTHMVEQWVEISGGLVNIGFSGDEFAFLEETPRHTVYLMPFRIAKHLVTNGQYLEFLLDGGYERADLWLPGGRKKRKHPIYWRGRGDNWEELTLLGWKKLDLLEPVSHVDFYEASAYAKWADARLPREGEWETATSLKDGIEGGFLEGGRLHPRRVRDGALNYDGELSQLYGESWQWTESPFLPYPRSERVEGEMGIYRNGFRPEEFVLRGGSCFTRKAVFRKTKRLHLPLASVYFCSGIRLVRDI